MKEGAQALGTPLPNDLDISFPFYGDVVTSPANDALEKSLLPGVIGGTGDDEIGRREKSTFGRLLTRYDRRLVLNSRFTVEGKGHSKRYKAESTLHGRMVEHGVSDGKAYPRGFPLGPETPCRPCDHAEGGAVINGLRGDGVKESGFWPDGMPVREPEGEVLL